MSYMKNLDGICDEEVLQYLGGNMNKTQEILEWYKHCTETGTMCCETSSHYLSEYSLQYNEAMRLYTEERLNKEFPRVEEL